MALTPLEVIAAAVIITSIIKVLMIAGDREQWLDLTQIAYDNPYKSKAVLIILAFIVFTILLTELTIVQIFAVMGFTSLLVMMEMFDYPEEVKHIAEKSTKDLTTSQYVFLAIWFFLVVWGFIEIFFV